MITSTSNSKIKNIIQLNTSSKARREQNAFIAEGIKMFTEAPPIRIKEVYVSSELLNRINIAERYLDNDDEDKLLRKCKEKLDKTGFTEVSDKVFKKMSDTVTPQGIISVVDRKTYELKDLIRLSSDMSLRVLILESVQDPGNLGTMIRTAEAAGFDFVLASEGTVDVYNPKVIRSTMGSVYRVPVIYTHGLKADIEELKGVGVKVYAAHLKGKHDYNKINFGKRTAIMIGNEGNGLSDEIAGAADEYIKIPMQGQVESLNAAVAAALLMFETFRTAQKKQI
jgi:TrmH family RNA methyltransferase